MRKSLRAGAVRASVVFWNIRLIWVGRTERTTVASAQHAAYIAVDCTPSR